jgi:DmsE family decaheme c-type cytochrome
MRDVDRWLLPGGLIAALALALALAWVATGATAARASDEDGAPPAWSAADLALRFPDPDSGADSADFAGAAACGACHEDREASLRTSFHAALMGTAEGGVAGCEACHGAGRSHAESDGEERVRHPLDVPAREMNGVCLRCHADVLTAPVRGHRQWTDPEPDDPDVRACTECHEVHVDRTRPEHAADTGPFRDIAGLAEVSESIPASRCIGCHPGFHPEMRRSGHADLLMEGERCETCHGPGSLHEASGGRARLIVSPARQPIEASNAGCNGCHAGGAVVQRWTCSEHAREGTGCVTCHDANAARGRTLRGSQLELCGGCHTDVKASFRLPNRHKVDRGRVLCTDCHDPHANRSRVRDRDVRVRSCEGCHAEKTGPFLHDHGIKRTEGCIACHAPHGSVNPRLLTHRRTKPLCLQCHPETPHDLAAKRFDSCISCHVEIHGSDIDRLFLR